MTIREQASEAARAARRLATLSTAARNQALLAMADALLREEPVVLAANAADMEAGRAKSLKASLLDRLLLTPERLADMAEGLRQVAALPDPVGAIWWIHLAQRPDRDQNPRAPGRRGYCL